MTIQTPSISTNLPAPIRGHYCFSGIVPLKAASYGLAIGIIAATILAGAIDLASVFVTSLLREEPQLRHNPWAIILAIAVLVGGPCFLGAGTAVFVTSTMQQHKARCRLKSTAIATFATLIGFLIFLLLPPQTKSFDAFTIFLMTALCLLAVGTAATVGFKTFDKAFCEGCDVWTGPTTKIVETAALERDQFLRLLNIGDLRSVSSLMKPQPNRDYFRWYVNECPVCRNLRTLSVRQVNVKKKDSESTIINWLLLSPDDWRVLHGSNECQATEPSVLDASPVSTELMAHVPPGTFETAHYAPLVPYAAATSHQPAAVPPSWRALSSNKRQKYAIVAILLGVVGADRWAMGKPVSGALILLVSVCTCGIGGVVLGLINGIRYLRMSEAEFDQLYFSSSTQAI